uniref:Uncharacterized protein n=1 Tax=Magnetospirillum gryphiswaldense TaxID=55518 RepID=Q3BKH3_9PROT|nr:hypothetical protein mgI397 [Magnetospirillum gryphiswaldense MSR-1]CAM77957.1 hypothetical protein MGR_4025 [Magnetospirillum gryphiswaldense MSR-1]
MLDLFAHRTQHTFGRGEVEDNFVLLLLVAGVHDQVGRQFIGLDAIKLGQLSLSGVYAGQHVHALDAVNHPPHFGNVTGKLVAAKLDITLDEVAQLTALNVSDAIKCAAIDEETGGHEAISVQMLTHRLFHGRITVAIDLARQGRATDQRVDYHFRLIRRR